MSSDWDTSGRYVASNCIDGDLNTCCFSAGELSPWLSIKIPPQTQVDYVQVHNRRGGADFQYLLSPYDVWLSPAPGSIDTAAGAIFCAHMTTPSTDGPFSTQCTGLVSGDPGYVTIRLPVNAENTPTRLVAISDVEIFTGWQPPRPPSLPPPGRR